MQRTLIALALVAGLMTMGCSEQPPAAPSSPSAFPSASQPTALRTVVATATLTPTPIPLKAFVGYEGKVGESETCQVSRRNARSNPARGEIASVSPLSVHPGTTVVIRGVDFGPGTSVVAYLSWPSTDSITRDLAVAYVASDGTFDLTFDVPVGMDRSTGARKSDGSVADCVVLIVNDRGLGHGAFIILEYLGPG